MDHKFPLTKPQKAMEFLTWGLAVVTLVMTMLRWRRLPAVIATHYDAYGVANDWGGRWTAFLLPVTLVLCCGLISLCERLPLKAVNLPFKPNPEREWYVLRAVRDVLCLTNLEIALLFAVMQMQILNSQQLAVGFVWCMTGVLLATTAFGIWRAWKCNQGTL